MSNRLKHDAFPCREMIFNTCFACSDCDGELPESLGFVLLDFKAALGPKSIYDSIYLYVYSYKLHKTSI